MFNIDEELAKADKVGFFNKTFTEETVRELLIKAISDINDNKEKILKDLQDQISVIGEEREQFREALKKPLLNVVHLVIRIQI